MVKLYGIPNCGTVKKTLDFFKSKNIEVVFHNYKTAGISEEKLQEWIKVLGLNKVVNKKGTTYRGLSYDQKAALENETTAVKVLAANPSVIKRPVVEAEKATLVGFTLEEYEAQFQ